MNGIKLFRLKQHRSVKNLASLTNLTEHTIKEMETERVPDRPSFFYMKIAQVLGVSVEALIADYPESALNAGDHFVRPARSSHPDNCLAQFREENNLNFEQLSELLGLKGRESARVACKRAKPKAEHVARLAALKGISEKEFRRRYSRDKEEVYTS